MAPINTFTLGVSHGRCKPFLCESVQSKYMLCKLCNTWHLQSVSIADVNSVQIYTLKNIPEAYSNSPLDVVVWKVDVLDNFSCKPRQAPRLLRGLRTCRKVIHQHTTSHTIVTIVCWRLVLHCTKRDGVREMADLSKANIWRHKKLAP